MRGYQVVGPLAVLDRRNGEAWRVGHAEGRVIINTREYLLSVVQPQVFHVTSLLSFFLSWM